MSLNTKIRIKLTDHSLDREYLESLRQWENEGGAVTINKEMLSSIPLPLRSGEVYEVGGGKLLFEDGDLIYEVELNLLSLR